MCQNLNVSLLGKVPLDPQIGNVTVLHYNSFKTVLVFLLGSLTECYMFCVSGKYSFLHRASESHIPWCEKCWVIYLT